MKSTFKNVWFWITVAILIFFLWKSCNKGEMSFFGCNKSDTLSHKIDTVITNEKSDTVYVPIERFTNKIKYIPKWYEKHDTTQISVPYYQYSNNQPCDELEKDYSTPRYYNDTLKFKNGIVSINEVVNNNAVLNRKVGLETYDTSIHETTTILKHKIVVYFGMKLFGMRSDFFHQGEINLGVRGKNDMEYTGGLGKIRGSKENVYSFEIKLPIRLFTHKK